MLAPPVRCRRDGPARPAEFWTARFRKDEAGAPLFRRVFWAWSADGDWRAPDQPRLAFARHDALYKLYVVQEVSRTDGQAPEEECDDFIRELLQDLAKVLFGEP
jgi:hypothetical protein